MSEPMIRLENVGKSYDGGKTYAVRNINLTIEKGDFVALLGPSGCGKSTTLMMLCGLYRPTEGNIYFNGRYVNNVMPKDRNIGMVFQSYALYPNLSIFENIAFPLRQMKTLKKKEIEERVHEVASIVKITELLKRMPSEISGGQQQRVAMCRALVKNPDILLLDEPMSNLDARLKLEIRDEIKKLQKKLNLTSIIVTHDQEEAMAIASHIAIIDQGSIQQYGEPNELYNMPENLFVASFIGNPPMNFIECAIEKKDNSYHCITDGGTIELPQTMINASGLTGNQVILGIRPHNFELVQSAENAFLLRTDYIEHLGKENLYRCFMENTSIRVITPVNVEIPVDQPLYVRPSLEYINVFDQGTRRNITVRK
jgi:inositol-phosphate transport system ATP-binding protein